mgnify:CR=1 FL=1
MHVHPAVLKLDPSCGPSPLAPRPLTPLPARVRARRPAAVIVFGATGAVGHALTKMLKEGHMGMKDIKVGARVNP